MLINQHVYHGPLVSYFFPLKLEGLTFELGLTLLVSYGKPSPMTNQLWSALKTKFHPAPLTLSTRPQTDLTS